MKRVESAATAVLNFLSVIASLMLFSGGGRKDYIVGAVAIVAALACFSGTADRGGVEVGSVEESQREVASFFAVVLIVTGLVGLIGFKPPGFLIGTLFLTSGALSWRVLHRRA